MGRLHRTTFEARVCLGVGRTNDGGQEHVGENARSKSDVTLKKCKDHRNLAGIAAGTAEVAASGDQSQLVTCVRRLRSAFKAAGRTEIAGTRPSSMGELLPRHTRCLRSSLIFRPLQRILVAVFPASYYSSLTRQRYGDSAADIGR